MSDKIKKLKGLKRLLFYLNGRTNGNDEKPDTTPYEKEDIGKEPKKTNPYKEADEKFAKTLADIERNNRGLREQIEYYKQKPAYKGKIDNINVVTNFVKNLQEKLVDKKNIKILEAKGEWNYIVSLGDEEQCQKLIYNIGKNGKLKVAVSNVKLGVIEDISSEDIPKNVKDKWESIKTFDPIFFNEDPKKIIYVEREKEIGKKEFQYYILNIDEKGKAKANNRELTEGELNKAEVKRDEKSRED